MKTINLEYLQVVYEANKVLDSRFEEKYLGTVNQYDEKNSISLTTEIAELANETKCFKYWSVKKMDIDKVKDELADCFMMILYRYNELKTVTIKIEYQELNTDILETFNNLFKLSTKLFKGSKIDIVNNLLLNLIHLKNLLNISDEECKSACLQKIKVVNDRLDSDY